MHNTDATQNISEAMALLSGQERVPTVGDYAQAAKLFEGAKDIPFAGAKFAVMSALGCGVVCDIEKSQALFLDAVMGGFPPLLRDMAVIVDAAGISEGLVATLLRRAAGLGDSTAAYLLVRAGIAGRGFLNQAEWQDLKNGLPNMPLIMQVYKALSVITPTAINTEQMRAALRNGFLPHTAKFTAQSDEHDVRSTISALTPMQCDYLIALSLPLMQPSKVVDDSGSVQISVQANFRTSDGAVLLPVSMDMPLVHIIHRLSAVGGIAPNQGEFLSLLRYHPGQEYLPHHDYLEADEADYSQIKRAGQRKATLLTYLNTGYDGGQTHFPKLGVSYKGGVGDALYFANTDAAGQGLPDSLHAGTPVKAGEKWLATLWAREKPFWPW